MTWRIRTAACTSALVLLTPVGCGSQATVACVMSFGVNYKGHYYDGTGDEATSSQRGQRVGIGRLPRCDGPGEEVAVYELKGRSPERFLVVYTRIVARVD